MFPMFRDQGWCAGSQKETLSENATSRWHFGLELAQQHGYKATRVSLEPDLSRCRDSSDSFKLSDILGVRHACSNVFHLVCLASLPVYHRIFYLQIIPAPYRTINHHCIMRGKIDCTRDFYTMRKLKLLSNNIFLPLMDNVKMICHKSWAAVSAVCSAQKSDDRSSHDPYEQYQYLKAVFSRQEH